MRVPGIKSICFQRGVVPGGICILGHQGTITGRVQADLLGATTTGNLQASLSGVPWEVHSSSFFPMYEKYITLSPELSGGERVEGIC